MQAASAERVRWGTVGAQQARAFRQQGRCWRWLALQQALWHGATPSSQSNTTTMLFAGTRTEQLTFEASFRSGSPSLFTSADSRRASCDMGKGDPSSRIGTQPRGHALPPTPGTFRSYPFKHASIHVPARACLLRLGAQQAV